MRKLAPEERQVRIQEHQKLLEEMRKSTAFRTLEYGMVYWADNRLRLVTLMVYSASLTIVVYKLVSAFAYKVDLADDLTLDVAKWMFGISAAAVTWLFYGFMRGFARHVVKGAPPLTEAPQIGAAPGTRLRACAEFLCSPKVFVTIVEPLIGDLQFEYFEALKRHRIWKARWIRIRYAYAFFQAGGLFACLAVLKRMWSFWRMI